ncbi:MAG: carbon-nitrogen hydrolase family protein [Geminicoccaceae bacterium]
MTRRLKVAAAQYPIDRLEGWQAYEAKLAGWVKGAVEEGAQLLVFPEYGAMELASLYPEPVPGDLLAQLPAVASLEERVVELHRALARRHGVYILGASLPAAAGEERFHNRAWLYGPDGRSAYQDKIVMTRFEREEWGVSGGSGLRLFDTAFGRLGVCICYDVQFPLLARGLVEAGAELILVPSVTETLHGYWRVRTGAQARALENQCYVVHAPVVGEAPWSPAVDVNRGAAAAYGPPDKGFPPDGIVTIGELDRPGWIHAELDLDLVATVRADGMVLNHRHWPEQVNATTAEVEPVLV